MKPQSLYRRLLHKVDKTVASRFFIDQWIILTGRGPGYRSLEWRSLTPLLPPGDRYWADPFVWRRNGCDYIFIEEKLYSTGRGRIACLALDADGGVLSQQVVLERPYHLSYPFLFEHEHELYMLPEMAEHGAVELYRCTRFPDQWQLVTNLLGGVSAADSTLLQHAGRWWLFTNLKVPGGSSLNALHLYSSADLLNGDWQPHPRNPVVLDVASARPAGRIFMQDDKLIRPAQDSSRRYGYGLKFQHILELSETDYRETTERAFSPGGSKYLATHTFNQAGDLMVIDAVLRRRK